MQYTVAIADDEEMMLNGLTRLIPWEEMGYRVATAVESGRGLIEFLEDNAEGGQERTVAWLGEFFCNTFWTSTKKAPDGRGLDGIDGCTSFHHLHK